LPLLKFQPSYNNQETTTLDQPYMANKVLPGIEEYTVVFYTQKLDKNIKTEIQIYCNIFGIF